MVLMSYPSSRRWVPNEWRNIWQLAGGVWILPGRRVRQRDSGRARPDPVFRVLQQHVEAVRRESIPLADSQKTLTLRQPTFTPFHLDLALTRRLI